MPPMKHRQLRGYTCGVAMSAPTIHALEEQLDSVVARLKATKDSDLRRSLLAEMRVLMADLDRLVLDPSHFPKTKLEPPK